MESRSWYEMQRATERAQRRFDNDAIPPPYGEPATNRAARRRKAQMDRAEAKRKERVPA
jgi:hypothetical protein